MDNMQFEMRLDIKPFTDSLGIAEDEGIEFGKNLGKDFDGVNVTVKDLLDRLDDIKKKFQDAPIGGEAWHRWKNESKAIGDELRKVKDEFNQTSPVVRTSQIQVGAFRTAITQSTYALREINPTLGDAATALNPLITGFNTGSVRGQGFKAMLGAVGAQIMGPLGIIAGIGILTTIITTWIKSNKDAEKSNRDLKDSLRELNSELDKASYQTLKVKEIEARIKLLDAENKLIAEQNEEYEKAIVNARVRSQDANVKIDKNILGSDETKAEVQTQKEIIKTISEYRDKLGLPKEQENKIAELRLKRLGLRSEAEIAAIDKEIAALEKLYKTTKDKATDTDTDSINLRHQLLTLTNEQLRVQLELNNAKLSDPDYSGSRVNILQENIEIQKQITENAKEYMRLFDSGKASGIPTSFDMSFVDSIPKPEAFSETNAELERMLFLSNTLTDSFNEAGYAVSSAMGASVKVFRQANSLGQIFINTLIQAAVKAMILKGIMTIFSLFTGGAASAVTPIAATLDSGGLFRGAPGVDKNIVRLSDGEFIVNARSTQTFLPYLNAINNAPAFANGGLNSTNRNIYNTVNQPIVLETQLRGRDIYLVQRREETYRKNYM